MPLVLEVQLISAPWCKRCTVIKPGVEQLCKNAGANLTVLNYDELDDGESIKMAVTALPTILMNGIYYTPSQYEEWSAAIMVAAVATMSEDTDF